MGAIKDNALDILLQEIDTAPEAFGACSLDAMCVEYEELIEMLELTTDIKSKKLKRTLNGATVYKIRETFDDGIILAVNVDNWFLIAEYFNANDVPTELKKQLNIV